MKRKLLFIAPDYYGFNEVVLKGLKEYSDCDVSYIVSNFKYQYKNWGERIYNFFLKTLLGRNLKEKKKDEYIKEFIKFINESNDYDILLINAPYLLTNNQIEIALKKTKLSVVIFWDSIEKIPMQKKYLEDFDIIYSFEPDDCAKYHLKKITNFYFAESNNDSNNLYDVCYLATYDERIKVAERIFKYFDEHNISVKGKMFVRRRQRLPKSIERIKEIIPFSKSYKYYLDSKIILDIAHPNQKGLSFRPYEAIGLRKKLITTNKDIVNYDFYNPNNIFVIEDIDNITIPLEFFKTDYQEIDIKLREKYHIKNWIHNIINGN
ncbi:lipopolysaccharide core biosynthesis protein rfaS [uncultured Capnocytophaga sp.]|uniref:lipopolysaccharide core biosynthesis protein rfaS n=1 Tax=uncultured Capnocytophaga sp. TaxID=159273 RepID=UPI002591473E|nr:lipopolysaccharide core biosynthesis protein rfaS [uncultured Capnocytophaga sp.]